MRTVFWIAMTGLLLVLAGSSPAVAVPPGMGACCLPNDRCLVDDQEDCEAAGGLYLGDGTNCGGVSCGCEREREECEQALEDCAVLPGDGAGLGPELSYTDNGDGTLTDNNTLLMWEAKIQGNYYEGDCLTEIHSIASECPWAEASGPWLDALNTEGGTGYAGYSDWRLPSIRELQNIRDFGRQETIDPLFGPRGSYSTWSATPSLGRADFYWCLQFSQGNLVGAEECLLGMPRAVRGGP